MLFSEMLDELQTTLPKSHLVYHNPGHAKGSRNVSVCGVFPLAHSLTTADNVVYSLELNNLRKHESVSNGSENLQTIVHLQDVHRTRNPVVWTFSPQ